MQEWLDERIDSLHGPVLPYQARAILSITINRLQELESSFGMAETKVGIATSFKIVDEYILVDCVLHVDGELVHLPAEVSR